MVSSSLKLIDIGCLILTIILVILVSANPLPESLEYIPDAVKGLTTLASILVGFIGFCMTYLYSSSENIEVRKRLKSRVLYVVLVIAFAFPIVGSAYTDLVYGRLFSSYKTILVGLILIIMLFVDTMFLLIYLEEEEQ